MAQIAEIIKYEGDNSTFIWKHPCEDFNTTTQLIVHESQEAMKRKKEKQKRQKQGLMNIGQNM